MASFSQCTIRIGRLLARVGWELRNHRRVFVKWQTFAFWSKLPLTLALAPLLIYACPKALPQPQAACHGQLFLIFAVVGFMMNSRHIRSSSSSCAKCALNIYAHLSAFAAHTHTWPAPCHARLLPQLVALAAHTKQLDFAIYLQLCLLLAKMNLLAT